MKLPLILAITGIILALITAWIVQNLRSRRKLKPYYSVIWKKSTSLTFKDMSGRRPYNNYYYDRDEDAILKRCLERRTNVLIVGPPLSGKTRLVYEQIKNLRNNSPILIPRSVSMERFVFPEKRSSKGKGIIFIDDLLNFVEKQRNFHQLFKKALTDKYTVVAACRSGLAFKILCRELIEQNLDMDTLFGGGIIELGSILSETGKQIALKNGIEWDQANFDGTIGSIFMKLSEMERRYESCTATEKSILQSLLNMNTAGLFSDSGLYDLNRLKLTAASSDLRGRRSDWSGWLKSLEQKELVRREIGKLVYADDTLLRNIVKKHFSFNEAGVLDEMIEVFKDDSDVLLTAGKRAYVFGTNKSSSARYMKAAVNAFNYLLIIAPAGRAELIMNAHKYRGLAYLHLSAFEDAAGNKRKALSDLNAAVKLTDKKINPAEFSYLQFLRGRVFSSLAVAGDTEKNCLAAIRLFKEALEVYDEETIPKRYAEAYFELGSIYLTLGKVKDPVVNFKNGTMYLKEALGYMTPDKYPEMYAETLNVLGSTYYTLGDMENKTENLKLAREYYSEFIGLLAKEKSPVAYSSGLAKLGNIHSSLASIEDTDKNCEYSLTYLNEAVEICTAERHPLQYADIQYWIGLTNLTLAGYRKSAKHCYKAIDAFEKSLSVINSGTHPFHFAFSREGLGDAYILLAELNEDKSENYRKSLAAYDEALSVYNGTKATALYNQIQEKITKAKKIFF